MARGRARRPDARHVTRPETGAGDTQRVHQEVAEVTLPPPTRQLLRTNSAGETPPPTPPPPPPPPPRAGGLRGKTAGGPSSPATPTPHARATAVQAKVAVPGWRWRLSRRFESSEVVGF